MAAPLTNCFVQNCQYLYVVKFGRLYVALLRSRNISDCKVVGSNQTLTVTDDFNFLEENKI